MCAAEILVKVLVDTVNALLGSSNELKLSHAAESEASKYADRT